MTMLPVVAAIRRLMGLPRLAIDQEARRLAGRLIDCLGGCLGVCRAGGQQQRQENVNP
jgi:hypothetical protein